MSMIDTIARGAGCIATALGCALFGGTEPVVAGGDPCPLRPQIGSLLITLDTGDTSNLGGYAVTYNSDDNEFLASWFDSRIEGQNDVYAQRIASTAALIGGNITVIAGQDSTTDTAVAYSPNEERYLITWRFQGGSPGSPNFNTTFGRLLNTQGTIASPVNLLSTAGHEASVAFNPVSNLFVHLGRAFASGTSGIHSRAIDDASGIPSGSQNLIASVSDGAPAPSGELTFNAKTGGFLALWRDQVEGRLRGRLLNSQGQPAAAAFTISDVFPGSGNAGSAAFDPINERFLVVHSGFSGDEALYGRFVSSDGTPLGTLMTLVDSGASLPRLAYDPVNSVFLLVWRDPVIPDFPKECEDEPELCKDIPPAMNSIMAQLLNTDAEPLGEPLELVAAKSMDGPRVAANTQDGGFFVIWRHAETGFDGPHDLIARLVNVEEVCENLPGDFDGDGYVGVPDLLHLLSAWGRCAEPLDCDEDLDGDGGVGVPDLLLLLGNWG